MNKIDILLVKPGSQKQIYGNLSTFEHTAIEPPLWAVLNAAHLRKCGYSVSIIDAEVEGLDWQQTANTVKEINPLLVTVVVSGSNPTASTMNMTGAGAIIEQVKKISPETKTLLMGLHPSALPEQTLLETGVDFLCQGEGFHTLGPLIDELKAKISVFSIPGLWYLNDGQTVSNRFPEPFKNLDQLPMPAWDLLPMKKYRAHNWHCFDNIDNRSPYGVIYSSLGCPFKCDFCCINSLFGKAGIRYRQPEVVVEEIDVLVNEYGIRNIKIIDEMFALKESHVVKLCNLIEQRDYGLNMWAYARVNTVNSNILNAMKRAGINWVAYGFEAGNQKVLENVSKRYNLDKVRRVVKMTRDEGLYICSNFIFGLPEDNYDTMHETLDLALEIKGEWANFYAAMANPGSLLYKRALENDWPLPESWEAYSPYGYSALPLPTRNLTGAEVLKFRDYAFQTYFTHPGYLAMIEQKFGTDTRLYVEQMAGTKLPRKYCASIE